jgi:hypothetical protein
VAYATQFRISLSTDGETWQTVASVDDHDGQPYMREFAPVQARYCRVSGLKPDGPDQTGRQMAVAELELYE